VPTDEGRKLPIGTLCAISSRMSSRAHFWLRVIGIAMIVGAEFLPRAFAHSRTVLAPQAPQAVSQLGN
jgi:hypothetical protein